MQTQLDSLKMLKTALPVKRKQGFLAISSVFRFLLPGDGRRTVRSP